MAADWILQLSDDEAERLAGEIAQALYALGTPEADEWATELVTASPAQARTMIHAFRTRRRDADRA